jgi:hypothetical protein
MMRKSHDTKSIFIIAVLSLCVLCCYGKANGGALWLFMDSTQQNPPSGGIFETQVKFTTWDASMGAYLLTVNYDPALLQIIQVSTPSQSVFNGNSFADTNSFSSGITNITAFQTTYASEQSTPEIFTTIKWKALGATGKSATIGLEAKTMVDFSWQPIEVNNYSSMTFDIQAPVDNDGDGYNSTVDCNDNDPKEHPAQTWYKDADGDGYSDGTINNTSCTRPIGYKTVSELLATSGDYDDNDPSVHPSGIVAIPQTGQTKCYDSAGSEISCAGTGQDGEIRAGVPWPNPRFTVGTGAEADCVTDNLTGLMWVQRTDNTERTWTDAITYANNFNLCGYSDWRLPNVSEFESLVNADEWNTASWLNTQGFNNVSSGWYWSSTSVINGALFVDMWDGSIDYDYKTSSYHVWPVRSGQLGGAVQLPATGQTISYAAGDDGDLKKGVLWPSPRFHDNGNGTVTDNLTGLIWLKDANCFGDRTWAEALLDSKNLLSGQCGLSDSSRAGNWRLPNRTELMNLIARFSYAPALPLNHPFINVQSDWYWTSTTSGSLLYYAWIVDMLGGYVDFYDKDGNYNYVWPVRGGEIGGAFEFSDLTVTSVSDPPTSRKRGSSFKIKAKIKNKGAGAADKEFTLGYYLSKNKDTRINKEADIMLTDNIIVSSLLAGASSTKKKISVNIGNDTPIGRYYVKVCADNRNDLAESNEDNNCRASKGKIKVK